MSFYEEKLNRMRKTKCYLKALRRHKEEKKELLEERDKAITMRQEEAIELRIKAIDDVVGDFLSKLYVLDRNDRKMIEIYIDAKDYQEFITMLQEVLGMSEKDYQKEMKYIAPKVYEMVDVETEVSVAVKERMEALAKDSYNK